MATKPGKSTTEFLALVANLVLLLAAAVLGQFWPDSKALEIVQWTLGAGFTAGMFAYPLARANEKAAVNSGDSRLKLADAIRRATDAGARTTPPFELVSSRPPPPPG